MNEGHIAELRKLLQGTLFEGVEHLFQAGLAKRRGDYPASFDHYMKSLDVARRLQFKITFVGTVILMAEAALKLGYNDLVLDLYREAILPAYEIGSRVCFPILMNYLVTDCLEKGEPQQAVKYLRMGLSMAPLLDSQVFVHHFLTPLVEAAGTIIPPISLARILGYIEEHSLDEFIREPLKHKERYDQLLNQVKTRLGDERFLIESEIGRGMTREQVNTLACQLIDEMVDWDISRS
jgi:hypothetical protein